MKKLQLPTVTLMQMETNPGLHRLAKLALDDCLAVADFGDVLVISDQFNELRTPGANHIRVESWPNKLGYARALWYQMPLEVKTPHVMIIQWDSHIIKPELWRDEFLDYDYIGSPWPLDDGLCVGNSGFSLRSKRLMDFLIENKETYPLTKPSEDAVLSRTYRRAIEKETGFTWAPLTTANHFAHEWNIHLDQNCFGFHSCWGWPYVLDKDRLIDRARLAVESQYIATTVYINENTMLEELFNSAPWLRFFIQEKYRIVKIRGTPNNNDTSHLQS